MATVQTVRGPVDCSELGLTLMHEHVFVVSAEVTQNYPEIWGDEEQRIADAAARLNELHSRGVGALVDLTVIGLGRYIPRIQKVAALTPLHIIVATGIYTYDEVPAYFQYRPRESMVDMFVGDIERGIGDTGVRAGILKCATDAAGITPGVERVLRAVAQAHRHTGAPISTHTHAQSRRGLEQQKIFQQEGVDLTRVIIGHSGDTTDLDYLEALLANGSYIGMDRFGIDTILPFEDRVSTVAALCERGYAKQMVLSQDASCYIDWFREETLARVLPNWHYLHLHNDVLPALRKRGVTEEQIRTIMVENPRRIFETQGAYEAAGQTA